MATIYYTASSIDGFIVDEPGRPGWLLSRNIDADGPFGYRAFSDSVGALVMGADDIRVDRGQRPGRVAVQAADVGADAPPEHRADR